ncbi:MAG: hypothetical protein AUK44_06135 [Porphyromonadaceae bacterium CG2_30_38_12]|nr:MAG: hypothetical protein AUK44_06135 [Porphyromonadaceae bacterium CG2_30_38_12]
MTFAGEKLFVVPGRLQFTEFLSGEVMILNKDNKNNNDEWMNIAASTIRDSTKYDVLNLMNIAVDSLDNSHFFVTSFGTGLYEFRNYKFIKWHTPLNSTLEPHYLVPNNPYRYTRLDGAVFDKNDNLFLTNSSVDKKIKILLKNGTWTSLKYEGLTNYDLGKILINNQNQNQKWVTAPHYGALGVFDDNGTLDIQTDDKFINFETFADADNEGSKISYKKGSCIAQDKNGIIWLGTDTGPLLFYNTSKVFDAGYTCSRVKIPRNNGTGLADYLLQSEHVKAIAIDGANRKWIGTETSGAYLLSENGQETIEHFTASNSPLLSNDVLSIEINPKTGEVFFGTGNGIVSYQSDAAESTGMYENVHAYPNPVRENFNGIITITGLVANTNVKITDLNGNLICQTVSNGAIATWNGKDTNGNKVRTGIYLAICANEDGTQSTITKIMVIN